MPARFLPLLPIAISSICASEPEPRITRIAAHPSEYTGTPVARDFDRDGDLDLFYLPGSAYDLATSSQGLLLENLGNRTFAPPRATHIRHRLDFGHAMLGDVTGDDQLDLLVLEQSTGTIIDGIAVQRPVAIGIPEPGTPDRRLAIEPYPAAGWTPIDLDGDEILELVDERSIGDGTRMELAIHDRQPDGSFEQVSASLEFPALVFTSDMPVVDLDGDHDLDLVALDPQSTSLVALERTGTRTFSPDPHPLAETLSGTWHDLDGDGLPELVLPGSIGACRWMPNLGSFSLGSAQLHSLGFAFENHRLLHVDSRPGEAALLTFGRFAEHTLSLLTVRFGTWDAVRSVSPETPAVPLSGESQIDLADDFDADGNPDILVRYFHATSGYSSVPRTAIAWGTSSGFEAPEFTTTPVPTPAAPLIADLDRDGSPDLILGPDAEGCYHSLLNDGRGRFPTSIPLAAISPPPQAPTDARITRIIAGSIAGDAFPDLVVSYSAGTFPFSQSATGVAIGRGDGTFAAPVLPEGSFDFLSTFAIGALVDWDGDGDLDGLSNGGWRENLGGFFDPATRPLIQGAQTSDALGNPASLEKYVTGDLDGDGARDILSIVHRIEVDGGGVLGGFLPSDVYAAVGFGDGAGAIGQIVEFPALTASSDFLGNPTAANAAIADLNRDGLNDLVVQEFTASDALGNPVTTTSWWRNPGNGSRDPSTWTKLPLRAPVPTGTLLDFNADGADEWVSPSGFVEPSPAGPRVSTAYDFVTPAHLNGFTHLGSADFDGDGDADFLLGDGLLWLALVRNRIVDEFSPIVRTLTSAGIVGMLAGPGDDADGDGRDNFTELIEGTDLLLIDEGPVDAHRVTLLKTQDGFTTTFRLPSRAVGIGSPADPITLSELGIRFQPETSTDLLHWQPHELRGEEITVVEDPWDWFAKDFPASGPSAFFRLRAVNE